MFKSLDDCDVMPFVDSSRFTLCGLAVPYVQRWFFDLQLSIESCLKNQRCYHDKARQHETNLLESKKSIAMQRLMCGVAMWAEIMFCNVMYLLWCDVNISWQHVTFHDISTTSHDIYWHHVTFYDISWHHVTFYDIWMSHEMSWNVMRWSRMW